MAMDKMIAVFTIFTLLLFSVTTARIALDPFTTDSVAVADSDDVLSLENPKSESENTQTIDVSTIDSAPRLRFVRSRPINRHFFDKTSRIPLRFVRRHPCRKFQKSFVLPRKTVSYGNDMILSGKTYSVDTKAFGDQVPTEWLEFKHKYGHQHHHHYHHDRDEAVAPKREHKGGFMRSFRKFLKHTFD